MRVALFFDGKNFYKGYKAHYANQQIKFSQLASWLVSEVDGERLWGAYYYTGVEAGDAAHSPQQEKLRQFLHWLRDQPGFFVFKFPRQQRESKCEHCGQTTTYTQEKEVDTSIVADMLRLAAVNAFDIAVLVSGDADLAPAVEGLRAVGKQVYIAAWDRNTVAQRLRTAAFGVISLSAGVHEFVESAEQYKGDSSRAITKEPVESRSTLPDTDGVSNVDEAPTIADIVLWELLRAERHFKGGFVGLSFFTTRWTFRRDDFPIPVRNRVINELVRQGLAEIYRTPDGVSAVRSTQGLPDSEIDT